MPLIAAYHRPTTLEAALSLLSGQNRVVLGGGTSINANREASDVEVVDLQALGLDDITREGDRVRLGAMTTLGSVANCDLVPGWLQGIALAEAPSTLRHLSTVGGSVASRSGESRFVAALLVADATIELAGGAHQPLADLLRSGVPAGEIITAITIDPAGSVGEASTGRTPGDVPIVAAVARCANGHTALALTGVANTPVLADPDDPTASLSPPADFRGSAQYRLTLAKILSKRAVEAAR